MAPVTTLTVAVVSYNVCSLLERCLYSVVAALSELDGPSTLVVVDNASHDGSAALVRHRFPQAHLMANTANTGFGAACNQALATSGESILFLNSDTELTPGSLPALLARLLSSPSAALVGPRLAYADGRPQPSRRRFPTPASLLVESTPLQWRFPGWHLLDRYYCVDLPAVQATPVDWLSGACLLARSAAIRQVGGFDPHFFMYFEEVDLARRLAAHGWQTWYEPAATVVHHHSRSADQDLVARDLNFYRSKYRYATRCWGGATARSLRYAAGVLFAAEVALQRVRGDLRQARRFTSLVRWHFSRDE